MIAFHIYVKFVRAPVFLYTQVHAMPGKQKAWV